jgi:hypothetical protein
VTIKISETQTINGYIYNPLENYVPEGLKFRNFEKHYCEEIEDLAATTTVNRYENLL